MTAKEMFEKLGYECFDDRERDGLPLSILYRKEDIPEVVGYVSFDLPDRRYTTNVENIESKNNGKLLQAINKQVEELGWNNETTI